VNYASGRDDNGDIEITAVQKMLSAMSGSLLTSLIGNARPCAFMPSALWLTSLTVTPLDVVRVRLQSQPIPAPTPLLTTVRNLSATSPRPLANLPPNLGVTACCREVFFINNHAEYCVASPGIGGLGNPADCAVEETQRKTFNSTFDGLRKIARNEGITTLWRGLSPTLLMTIPANIIYFTGYDWLRFNRASPVNRIVRDNYAPLVAGSVARILAAFVVSPIEMFRTRMQASTTKSSTGLIGTTIQGVREMIQIRGYTSLWRGLNLTLWRDVPFSGIYWWGYETIRGRLTDARERGREPRSRARSRSQSRENHTATFIDSFTAGALSGAVASVLTMPFDVGKTRQQVFKDSSNTSNGGARVLAPEERSMPRFLWHIFKTEGAAGLWKGWVARTLKVAPACAIMISSYEVGKRMARSINARGAEQRAAR
jgi:solute carrier family 25 protein 39/40